MRNNCSPHILMCKLGCSGVMRHASSSLFTALNCLLLLCSNERRLLVEYSDPARAGGSLAVVDPKEGTLTDLHTPFTSFGSLSVAQVVHSAKHVRNV